MLLWWDAHYYHQSFGEDSLSNQHNQNIAEIHGTNCVTQRKVRYMRFTEDVCYLFQQASFAMKYTIQESTAKYEIQPFCIQIPQILLSIAHSKSQASYYTISKCNKMPALLSDGYDITSPTPLGNLRFVTFWKIRNISSKGLFWQWLMHILYT